jgi:hypothetical protein
MALNQVRAFLDGGRFLVVPPFSVPMRGSTESKTLNAVPTLANRKVAAKIDLIRRHVMEAIIGGSFQRGAEISSSPKLSIEGKDFSNRCIRGKDKKTLPHNEALLSFAYNVKNRARMSNKHSW